MIGFIGSGNMARALALGWGEPVLCTDVLRERAEKLAKETGGKGAFRQRGAGRPGRRRDPLPQARAAQRGRRAGGRPGQGGHLDPRRDAAAGGQGRVQGQARRRLLPSTPVEVRQGVIAHARDPQADHDLERKAIELFSRVGKVVTVEDKQVDVAMGLMSSAPAYMALVAEAQIDAGVRFGIPAEQAAEMVVNDGRDGRADRAPRLRHAEGPPRGHEPGRLDREGVGGAGAKRPTTSVRRGHGGDQRMTSAFLVIANTQNDVADFLQALLRVYIILILVYIVVNLLFAFGAAALQPGARRCPGLPQGRV